MRIGIGYDVHRLVPGRSLVLGGIVIPCEKGLLGHSDADVLVHAVCDAMLGAAGLGDIGQHFPDTDPAYKDISSLKLLSRVAGMLSAENLAVANIDITVCAESPRLSPHKQKMAETVAAVLDIPVKQINIKATTMEGLGMIGKGEGISAMSVVLLRQTP